MASSYETELKAYIVNAFSAKPDFTAGNAALVHKFDTLDRTWQKLYASATAPTSGIDAEITKVCKKLLKDYPNTPLCKSSLDATIKPGMMSLSSQILKETPDPAVSPLPPTSANPADVPPAAYVAHEAFVTLLGKTRLEGAVPYHVVPLCRFGRSLYDAKKPGDAMFVELVEYASVTGAFALAASPSNPDPEKGKSSKPEEYAKKAVRGVLDCLQAMASVPPKAKKTEKLSDFAMVGFYRSLVMSMHTSPTLSVYDSTTSLADRLFTGLCAAIRYAGFQVSRLGTDFTNFPFHVRAAWSAVLISTANAGFLAPGVGDSKKDVLAQLDAIGRAWVAAYHKVANPSDLAKDGVGMIARGKYYESTMDVGMGFGKATPFALDKCEPFRVAAMAVIGGAASMPDTGKWTPISARPVTSVPSTTESLYDKLMIVKLPINIFSPAYPTLTALTTPYVKPGSGLHPTKFTPALSFSTVASIQNITITTTTLDANISGDGKLKALYPAETLEALTKLKTMPPGETAYLVTKSSWQPGMLVAQELPEDPAHTPTAPLKYLAVDMFGAAFDRVTGVALWRPPNADLM